MSREYQATADHTQYIPAVNQTRIVIWIDGEVDVRHGEPVTVTTKEGR